MTPENDVTLRGIFRPHTKGLDVWNDVRDYDMTYGTLYHDPFLGTKDFRIPISFFLDHKTKHDTILHNKKEEIDYNVVFKMYDWFPESKNLKSLVHAFSYGFGDGTTCDCCGVELNVFNSSDYYMCAKCERVENLEQIEL